MSSFTTRPLYGGAIIASLPSAFRDARSLLYIPRLYHKPQLTPFHSTIREIPDNQEVYLDADGYASITFDILEHVPEPSNEDALTYHFEDLTDDTGDETETVKKGSARLEKMP
jgi:hypothetical protein